MLFNFFGVRQILLNKFFRHGLFNSKFPLAIVTRREKLRWFTVSFLIGVWLASVFPRLLPGWLWGCAGLGLLLWRQIVLMGVICGMGWLTFAYALFLREKLPTAWQEQPVLIQGTIIDLPQLYEGYSKFRLCLTGVKSANHWRSVHIPIQLTWTKPHPAIHVGERWQLMVILKKNHALQNPGAMDFSALAVVEHTLASGTIKKSFYNQKLPSIWTFSLYWQSVREHLRNAILKALDGHSYRGVILALVLGERSYLTSEQWLLFQKTGTSHLIAISGLHVGLIIWCSGMLIAWLWSACPRLLLACPKQHVALYGGTVVGFIYSALAGFAVPTLRAIILAVLLAVMQYLRRVSDAGDVFCLCLLGVLLLQPFAVLTPSFWLSFSAVAMLLFLSSYRVSKSSIWRLQIGLSMGLAPISLLFFQATSLVGILANLIAIPVVGWGVVPLALLGTVTINGFPIVGTALLQLAATVGAWVQQVLFYLSDWPYSIFYQAITPWQFVILLLSGLWLLAPSGWPARWLGIVGIAVGFLPQHKPLPMGLASITVLDVGQGLSVVVETARHVLIYDTGPAYEAGFDAGRQVLVPFLRSAHINRIDRLFVSHEDNDHRGGAKALLAYIPVNFIVTSVPEKFPNYPVGHCVKGMHWTWDGVDFRVLYPELGNSLTDNNHSCVLQIRSHQHALLLPGDIEQPAEALLLQQSSALKSTILLAPHHGSITSSSAAFIQAVLPQIVIVSAGYLNRYHLPSPVVISRFSDQGAKIYNTAKTGALQFIIGHNNSQIEVRSYQARHRRFFSET